MNLHWNVDVRVNMSEFGVRVTFMGVLDLYCYGSMTIIGVAF